VTQRRRRRPLLVDGVLVGGAALAAFVMTACSTGDAESHRKAEELVAATEAAGVAPRLTVDVAEALYGDDAAAVCDAFDGSLGSAGRLLLFGNPSGRRPKTITTRAVEYSLLVVETYCPEHLEHLRSEVEDLHPFEAG
jgi:hypothetical protein